MGKYVNFECPTCRHQSKRWSNVRRPQICPTCGDTMERDRQTVRALMPGPFPMIVTGDLSFLQKPETQAAFIAMGKAVVRMLIRQGRIYGTSPTPAALGLRLVQNEGME